MSEEMKWQTIESAPKDGTPILGCSLGYYVPQYIVWATYHPNAQGKECWRTSDICGNKVEGISHWMPLPKPPISD
jgi:hypothetical protein